MKIKRPPLTPSRRGRIQALREQGLKLTDIAKDIGCFPGAVRYTLQRLKETSSHYNRARSGRPPKLKPRQQRAVLRAVRNRRWNTWQEAAAELTANGIDVTATDVRRVAHKHHFKRYRALLRPFLNPTAISKRKIWAANNSRTDWRRVVFTDESSIDTGDIRPRPRVIRMPGQGAHPSNVRAKFHSQRKTVMVWAVIAYGKKSPLVRLSGTGVGNVNAARYTDVVLRGPLRDFVLACELEKLQAYQVVEDNAPVYNARSTNTVRVALGIQRKFHPPLSPDLNPIEKAWRALKAALRKRRLPSYTPDAVWEAAKEEWEKVDIEKINKYIDDMPNRVQLVRRRKGGFAE